MSNRTSMLVTGILTVLSLFGPACLRAADHLTADQVREAVKAAPAGKVDLSGRDMSGDDLTDLDLTGANLARANLRCQPARR